MSSRQQITDLLEQLEADLKSLEVAYEQYFLGIEKRAPEPLRQKLTLLFRRLLNKYIPQTDLKFRLRGLNSRFQSYTGYWDRIMRLIEEGEYERHTSRIQRRAESKPSREPSAPERAAEDTSLDNLYVQLVDAHQTCNMKAPNRDQVAKFLAQQKNAIQQKFGDRQVEFMVVTESGKPKIKVRAKN